MDYTVNPGRLLNHFAAACKAPTPITGGRGYFTMELDHYDVVPTQIAAQIIEVHKKEMEAKKEE